jgi:hypothetical protein
VSTYNKQLWINGPAGSTPLSAPRLNYMEDGIELLNGKSDVSHTHTDKSDIGHTHTGYAAASHTHAVADLTATGTRDTTTFLRGDNTWAVPPGTGGGGGGGTSTIGDLGAVLLDSFTGADDDAKLTAALSAIAADTYPRAIQLTNRQYSFATVNRVPFDGMKIMGPRGYGNPERNSGTKTPGRVALSGNGAWFAPTATTFSVSLHNLSFTGGSSASVIGGTGNWYCLSMQGIFSSGLKSVIGSQATKALLTAASFTGDWEINNCYNGAFHMGGSDNAFWTDGMLLDSGTAFASSGGAGGQAHIWMDGMDKSYVGPLYITAEGVWTAIRHTGNSFNNVSNNQGGPILYHGLRIEGRNEGASAYGRLISVEGGVAIFNACAINFAMSDPSNAGIGRTDLGVIMHTGGQLDVTACNYDRANTVGVTVPFVYTNTTADAVVTRIKRTARGGSWGSSKPIVARPVANADNIIVSDATITKTTV